ncbi:MAG: CRISPR-associated endonuclease Cas1 [Candidatus Delongbacteria bacterium]|nr:CRISPR-associated endonuclease Cas1 [Candidatus Delongbacteria bacterium]
MDLIFTTPGTYLSVKDGMFLITVGENKNKISPLKTERIIVTTEAVITTAAITLCFEYNIDLLIIDTNGDPIGRFWHSKYGSITTIRRRQLEIAESGEGLAAIKEWITEKIKNQIDFIAELAKNRPRVTDLILEKAETIKNNLEKIKDLSGSIDENRGIISGLEGSSSRVYFEILSDCIPEKYKFNGRSRQPAKDPFNAFLNYAYGVMYGLVERAIVISGLDPFTGLMHTDNYNKKSLVFDIIENFRIFADRAVFFLFSKKEINDSMFDEIVNGFTLNKEGKKHLFTEFNQYLDTLVRYGNKNMKRRDVIQSFCHKFANSLIKNEEDKG